MLKRKLRQFLALSGWQRIILTFLFLSIIIIPLALLLRNFDTRQRGQVYCADIGDSCSSTSCCSGLNCNSATKTCQQSSAAKRYTCLSTGACTQSTTGDYLSLGECGTDCKPQTTAPVSCIASGNYCGSGSSGSCCIGFSCINNACQPTATVVNGGCASFCKNGCFSVDGNNDGYRDCHPFCSSANSQACAAGCIPTSTGGICKNDTVSNNLAHAMCPGGKLRLVAQSECESQHGTFNQSTCNCTSQNNVFTILIGGLISYLAIPPGNSCTAGQCAPGISPYKCNPSGTGYTSFDLACTIEFDMSILIPKPEICFNSVDDNGDGKTDCMDTGCAQHEACMVALPVGVNRACYGAPGIVSGCSCGIRRRPDSQFPESGNCTQGAGFVDVSSFQCCGQQDYFNEQCGCNVFYPSPTPLEQSTNQNLLPAGSTCQTNRICISQNCQSGTCSLQSAPPPDDSEVIRWIYGAYGSGYPGWGSIGYGIDSLPQTAEEAADNIFELCAKTKLESGQHVQCHADIVIAYPRETGYFYVNGAVELAEEVLARGGTVSFNIRMGEQVADALEVIEGVWSGTSPLGPIPAGVSLSIDPELYSFQNIQGYTSNPTNIVIPLKAEEVHQMQTTYNQQPSSDPSSNLYIYEVGTFPTFVSDPHNLNDTVIPVHSGYIVGDNTTSDEDDQIVADKLVVIANMNTSYNTQVSGCMVYRHRGLGDGERDGFDDAHAEEFLSHCHIRADQ